MRAAALSLTLAAGLLFSGCDDGGGGSGGGFPAAGTVDLAITDAPGDDLRHFIVGIDSIRLRSQSGDQLNILGAPTTVDFTELSQVTELLGNATVFPQVYSGVSIDLDFGRGQVVLQGQSSPAALLDPAGNPLVSRQTINIDFTNSNPLTVQANGRKLLVLDFDLAASVIIADSNLNQVRLAPVILPRVDPPSPKPMLFRGRLLSSDTIGRATGIELRRPGDLASSGAVAFGFGPATVFELDGRLSIGDAGFNLLAGRGSGLGLRARGLRLTGGGLVADRVRVGRGVDNNGGYTLVIGTVTTRTGSASSPRVTLTDALVRGLNGRPFFNATVAIAATRGQTQIIDDRSAASLDTDALLPGQRVAAYGVFDSSQSLLLATTPDQVIRLLPTTLFGTANGAPSAGQLSVNLSGVETLGVGALSFDAGIDPSSFLVDVSPGIGGILAGTPVELSARRNPLGSPSAATAAALLNRARDKALFALRYPGGQVNALSVSAANTLQISVLPASNPPAVLADLDLGPGGRGPIPNSPAPSITAGGSRALYILKRGSGGQSYGSFTAFLNAVTVANNAGNAVLRVEAIGRYDAASNRLAAESLVVTVR